MPKRIAGLLALAVTLGCGAEDLSIRGNLDADDDCAFSADEGRILSESTYDIAEDAGSGSEACLEPYLAHLLVDNPNSDTVNVESAEVTLMTLQRQIIFFDRQAQILPNPFLASVASSIDGSRGVVSFELVPQAYSRQLDSFVDQQLIARIKLFGAVDGSELESNDFSLPLSICDGCRTACLDDNQLDERDTRCSSLSLGADRLFCLDPGC